MNNEWSLTRRFSESIIRGLDVYLHVFYGQASNKDENSRRATDFRPSTLFAKHSASTLIVYDWTGKLT